MYYITSNIHNFFVINVLKNLFSSYFELKNIMSLVKSLFQETENQNLILPTYLI